MCLPSPGEEFRLLKVKVSSDWSDVGHILVPRGAVQTEMDNTAEGLSVESDESCFRSRYGVGTRNDLQTE